MTTIVIIKKNWCFISFIIVVLLCPIGAGFSKTATILGADEVISELDKSLGEVNHKQSDTDEDKATSLMNDIVKFKAKRMTMPADEAVDTWLNLYDRFWMLPRTVLMKTKEINPGLPGGENRLSATSLIAAIPPPETWSILKKHILKRPAASKGSQDTVLQILAYYLNKDNKNFRKSIAELKANSAMSGSKANYMLAALTLNDFASPATASKKGVVDSFEAYLQSLQAERPEGRLTVNVPDIVSLAGEKRATALIKYAITIPGVTLRVPSGDRTLELAKQIVQENANKLIEPQWDLVTSIYDLDLYDYQAKRFPDKENKKQNTAGFQDPKEMRFDFGRIDEGRRRAKIFYTIGLIASNRVNDAIEQAKSFKADDIKSEDFEKTWQSFEKIRYATALTNFCTGLLTEKPELPIWGMCGVVVPSDEARQRLIAIAETAGNRQDLSPGARLGIKERYVEVLLAMDRVDDALKIISQIVNFDANNEAQTEQQAIAQVKYRMIARMCELGRLLGRTDLVQESSERTLNLLGQFGYGLANNAWDETSGMSAVDSVINTLLNSGDYVQAEKIVLAAMQSSLKSPQLNMLPNKRDMVIANSTFVSTMTKLVEIYDRAGRPDDVVKLIERSSYWGAPDLIDIAEAYPLLPPLAAKALHNTGRDAEAITILKGHLYGYPGDDKAYEALVEISGQSLIPWLDDLYERDRFEKRPLIWKAYLLKQQGKFDEAEAVVRRAIKIDPTDGEQKSGDRGRAYVVLAEVLKARGKQDDANFFERVVTAIRIAEEGDAFTKVGLLRKSLTYYEKAADYFADAYCVQWRMAERMAAIGDHDGARKHYELAFERLPEQFGQVAHFCFGCEGVFTHQQSQSVADEVLSRLEKTEPQKPQVQFLLGQLRESQGRKAEAYRYFRKAAELDPQYLDAWKAAYDLRLDVFLQQEEIDEIALYIIRQDPMHRHANINADAVFDQKGLWSVYEQVKEPQVQIPTHLLSFITSKNEIDAILKRYGTNSDYYEVWQAGYIERRTMPEPGDTVAKNKFVQSLIRYLLTTSTGM
jgi:tetratricopeptide (TPR) repeat protein